MIVLNIILKVLIIAIVICFVSFSILIALEYCSYRKTIDKNNPTLTRDKIEEIYKNNPGRIKVNADGPIRFYISDYNTLKRHSGIYFNLSFQDWLWLIGVYDKYGKSVKEKELLAKQKENMEKIEEVLRFDKH